MVLAVLTAPAHASSTAPTAAIALAAIAVALVLIAALWAFARWQGAEPEWWQSLRRSFVEAGWHAEAAWADFADWLRVGR